MFKANLELGKFGEKQAIQFLKQNSYKILSINYKTKLGEIDIIALDQDVVCFIEVKTRKSDRFGLPSEAVTIFKQKQIVNSAWIYLKTRKLLDKKARFDIVSVNCFGNNQKITLIKDAFSLEERQSY